MQAIHEGELDNVETRTLKYFDMQVPLKVQGIPDDIMHPERGWASKIEYQEALSSLALEFINNYTNKYKGQLGEHSAAVDAAIPKI